MRLSDQPALLPALPGFASSVALTSKATIRSPMPGILVSFALTFFSQTLSSSSVMEMPSPVVTSAMVRSSATLFVDLAVLDEWRRRGAGTC